MAVPSPFKVIILEIREVVVLVVELPESLEKGLIELNQEVLPESCGKGTAKTACKTVATFRNLINIVFQVSKVNVRIEDLIRGLRILSEN